MKLVPLFAILLATLSVAVPIITPVITSLTEVSSPLIASSAYRIAALVTFLAAELAHPAPGMNAVATADAYSPKDERGTNKSFPVLPSSALKRIS